MTERPKPLTQSQAEPKTISRKGFLGGIAALGLAAATIAIPKNLIPTHTAEAAGAPTPKPAERRKSQQEAREGTQVIAEYAAVDIETAGNTAAAIIKLTNGNFDLALGNPVTGMESKVELRYQPTEVVISTDGSIVAAIGGKHGIFDSPSSDEKSYLTLIKDGGNTVTTDEFANSRVYSGCITPDNKYVLVSAQKQIAGSPVTFYVKDTETGTKYEIAVSGSGLPDNAPFLDLTAPLAREADGSYKFFAVRNVENGCRELRFNPATMTIDSVNKYWELGGVATVTHFKDKRGTERLIVLTKFGGGIPPNNPRRPIGSLRLVDPVTGQQTAQVQPYESFYPEYPADISRILVRKAIYDPRTDRVIFDIIIGVYEPEQNYPHIHAFDLLNPANQYRLTPGAGAANPVWPVNGNFDGDPFTDLGIAETAGIPHLAVGLTSNTNAGSNGIYNIRIGDNAITKAEISRTPLTLKQSPLTGGTPETPTPTVTRKGLLPVVVNRSGNP